jgi:hypothetical protein
MGKRVTFSQQSISIVDVATYHEDTDASLRMIFTSAKFAAYHPLRLFVTGVNPTFAARFIGKSPSAIDTELADRLNETDLRSSLAILVRIDAAFRIDYIQRSQKRKRDPLSRAFRALYARQGPSVRLEDDIFDTWQREHPESVQLIRELKGAFKFRHWLAHGSYLQPKLGRKYDYQGVYNLADSVLTSFPLYGR